MDRWDGKKVKDWSGYVGCRCIIVEDRPLGDAIEVKVLEVSPKGRVKFKYPGGYEGWEDKDKYLLIEALYAIQDKKNA